MEPVKIVFICGSLEPGKDGVGDYTRKLACALIKNGSMAKAISINDRRLKNDVWQDVQYDNEVAVEVLRLSASIPWKLRMAKAKAFINSFKCEWISLQYVPFGFHLKGLPFGFGTRLWQIADKQRWHIMFHELSVNKDESLKFKLWSWLQVNIIKSLLTKLKPSVINTNTELYKVRLEEMGFQATVLSLFSNITKTDINNKDSFSDIIPAFILQHRQDYIIGTLFGSFDYKRWDMRSLLKQFNYSFSKKRIVIVSLGRMSAGEECWKQLKKEFPQVLFITLGQQSPEFISYWLTHYTNFGILTTLPELAGKSGSFMAFKEHGIPVVCNIKTASLSMLNLETEEELIEVIEGSKFNLPSRQTPVSQLEVVTQQFLDELHNIGAAMSKLQLENAK